MGEGIPKSPPCPECWGPSDACGRDGVLFVWQCTTNRCLYRFATSAVRSPGGVTPPHCIPDARPPTDGDAQRPDPKPVPEPEREETNVAKNEPLPPLSEAGPCRRGCGRQLGGAAGPRGKHEKHCDGTPKSEKPTRAPRRGGPRKPRDNSRRARRVDPEAGQDGTELIQQIRLRVRLLRESAERITAVAEKQLKQAARLEEVASEVETF